MSKNNTRPILIGITGNIGSGKSTLCGFLADLGIPVISADAVASSFLEDPRVLEEIHKRWGDAVIYNGRACRQTIASIIFQDSLERQFLNELIHPLVLREFDQIVQRSVDSHLCFEIPLLFEAGLEGCLDYIVLITSPEDTRVSRVIIRDRADEKSILDRASSQMTERTKIPRSDLVIKNEGDIASLRDKAVTLADDLTLIKPRIVLPFYREGL